MESEHPKEKKEHPGDGMSEKIKQFECKVCLEIANEPVVTQCGHLFCWNCIYKWASHKGSKDVNCPVCKHGINIDKLIPLYTSCEAHNKR